MDKLKQQMIRRAQKSYKVIYPCGDKECFSDCFTTMGDRIIFWFNTEDHSTKLITVKRDKEFVT